MQSAIAPILPFEMASAAKPDADEKEPRAGDALASVQPPTADLPWRFGQISAVCH